MTAELPKTWNRYPDVVAFLDSLGNEMAGARYDLDTAAMVIPRLCPSRFAPAVLVAGTNGKGSVCWWLSAVFQAAGYHPALYTSPHLLDLRERIRIDGEPVAEDVFLRHANEALAVVADLGPRLPRPPSYYEWITFVAAGCFRAAGADIHILEVGMGGRLDAVNTADPVLSVITAVDLDHCRVLGRTVAEIAREKMGILRPEAPAVIGPQDEWSGPLREELASRAGEVVWARELLEREIAPAGSAPDRPLGLAGRYQWNNAATVLAAGRKLRELGWKLPEEAIWAGLARGGWPGRMEQIGRSPAVILDGAHNPHAIRAVTGEWQTAALRPVVVFGAMRDKDHAVMIALLARQCRAVILTRAPSARAAGLEEFAPHLVPGRVEWREDPRQALARAVEVAAGDTPVYVLGSLYLVAEIKRAAAAGELARIVASVPGAGSGGDQHLGFIAAKNTKNT